MNSSLDVFEVDSTVPVVDESVIERLRALESPEDEVPFAKQMINGFLSSAPGMMESLKTAFDKQSEKEVTYWAHKFAGFAMNVGGRRFATLCQRIESTSAKAIAHGKMSELVSQHLTQLIDALKKV